MRGTTPAVETVTRRGAIAKPFGCKSVFTASTTFARLSSGSPMPMNTMLVMRRLSGSSAAMRTTCSTISATVRFRTSPILPVAQNEHASGQPTWVETHSVVRLSSGISTASSTAPSFATSAALIVPSIENCGSRTLSACES